MVRGTGKTKGAGAKEILPRAKESPPLRKSYEYGTGVNHEDADDALLGDLDPRWQHLSHAARVKALPRIKPGLAKYMSLQARLHDTNVATDRDFQRAFNGFYRVRRSAAWQQKFYALMEREKRKPRGFEAVLRELHGKLERVEASFASKLAATVDPSPVSRTTRTAGRPATTSRQHRRLQQPRHQLAPPISPSPHALRLPAARTQRSPQAQRVGRSRQWRPQLGQQQMANPPPNPPGPCQPTPQSSCHHHRRQSRPPSDILGIGFAHDVSDSNKQ